MDSSTHRVLAGAAAAALALLLTAGSCTPAEQPVDRDDEESSQVEEDD